LLLGRLSHLFFWIRIFYNIHRCCLIILPFLFLLLSCWILRAVSDKTVLSFIATLVRRDELVPIFLILVSYSRPTPSLRLWLWFSSTMRLFSTIDFVDLLFILCILWFIIQFLVTWEAATGFVFSHWDVWIKWVIWWIFWLLRTFHMILFDNFFYHFIVIIIPILPLISLRNIFQSLLVHLLAIFIKPFQIFCSSDSPLQAIMPLMMRIFYFSVLRV